MLIQQKEVDFLHNENQLLEGYLQRVRASSSVHIVGASTIFSFSCLQVAASLLVSVADEERQVLPR